MADEATKQAATSTCIGLFTILAPSIAVQDKASTYEQSMWLKRGAIKIAHDGPQKGLWCNAHGHFVLPTLKQRTYASCIHNQ